MKLREQAEAVGAQRGVVGVDHHGVEEGVDRGFQDGEGLQRRRGALKPLAKRRQRTAAPRSRPSSALIHQLHHDETGVATHAGIKQIGNVRMLHFGQHSHFFLESLDRLLIEIEFRRQNFNRDTAMQM